jgi:alanine-synthesizing transaminase
VITASTSEAYAYLFKLLCNPGDEVLVPRPSYPLFDFLASLESVQVRQYPLFYQDAWHIDLHALRQAVTPRTRAIVLVNPNNPTGSYLKRLELEVLVELGLPIISDEVFSEYSFEEESDRITTLADTDRVLTFSLSGLSKLCGLPQMKLGWMVVNGPARESAEAMARLELIADTFLSVGTPVQVALPSLLKAGASVRRQIQERTRANLALVKKHALHVEGGWYAILRVPRVRTEEEWVLHLLEHHDVLVQPGFFYDFESEAFLVLSLLTREDTFREGLERILGNESGISNTPL